MERELLLKNLTELDFMAVDLGLYLDTHPLDSTAIGEYNKVINAASVVRERYEQLYGPICSFRSEALDQSRWLWDNNPWPWENSFNFDFNAEECR